MILNRLLRRLIPVEFQPPSHPTRKLLAALGYFRFRAWLGAGGRAIPDIGLYQPLYSPWLGEKSFEALYRSVAAHTLVSRDRCFVLWRTLQQAMQLRGDLVECGVFRGGTALLAAQTAPTRRLHLFDTFEGMPATANTERFSPGDFGRTSLQTVRNLLAPYPKVQFHPGVIPQTFTGLDVPAIAFAHVDVDLYQSVADCIAWIYPRLVPGGYMIFDDYGFPSCSGARAAVDEAFVEKPERPLCLPTGQCLVVKLPPIQP